jgi:hypothetical protein
VVAVAARLFDPHDVGRLQVTVDDAQPPREVQRARAFEDHFEHVADRQQPVGPGVALQRAATHVFHHDVGRVGVGHGVEDLHDVRVRELAGQRRFGDEELLLIARCLAVAFPRRA